MLDLRTLFLGRRDGWLLFFELLDLLLNLDWLGIPLSLAQFLNIELAPEYLKSLWLSFLLLHLNQTELQHGPGQHLLLS